MGAEYIPTGILKKILAHGRCSITINGKSMEPLLHEGDRVSIVSFDKIRVNDIILAEINQKRILHRVIGISNSFFITKGDNNEYMDIPIPFDCVLGKMEMENTTICNRVPIAFNFWNKDYYTSCYDKCKMLNLEYYYDPCCLFDDGINIAVIPYAANNLFDYLKQEAPLNQKVYFHIGSKITDPRDNAKECADKFDFIIHSGSLISSALLSHVENFLIFYGECCLYFPGKENLCLIEKVF